MGRRFRCAFTGFVVRDTSLPVARVGGSDVQRLFVDGPDPLVGAFEAITSLVDLLLGEILHHEEMPHRIARLDELAVRGDDLNSFDHVNQLTVSRSR